MIAIIGFRYRKYTHYTLYGSCPPIYGIAIIRSLLFLFLAHFMRTLTFESLSNPVLH